VHIATRGFDFKNTIVDGDQTNVMRSQLLLSYRCLSYTSHHL